MRINRCDQKNIARFFWVGRRRPGVSRRFWVAADQSQGTRLREILANVVLVIRVTKVASVISLNHSYLCDSFCNWPWSIHRRTSSHDVRERLLTASSIRRTLGRPGRHSTCSVRNRIRCVHAAAVAAEVRSNSEGEGGEARSFGFKAWPWLQELG